jgi:hypothetical protein
MPTGVSKCKALRDVAHALEPRRGTADVTMRPL